MESDPAARNVIGLIKANPEVGRKAIRLRQFGQEIIRKITGKSVHPSWATPGGVREPLTYRNARVHPAEPAGSVCDRLNSL